MKIKEIVETIIEIKNDITTSIYYNYKWIKKVIIYAKFLRKDYDHDFSSILRLLRFKISQVRNCIKTNNLIVRAEEVCSQMEHAEALIQRILDDEFNSEEISNHTKKWGLEYFPEDSDEWRVSKIAMTPEQKIEMQDEFNEIVKLGFNRKEKCKRELFDHLYKYIEEWWD
jgi:hypothetical protein